MSAEVRVRRNNILQQRRAELRKKKKLSEAEEAELLALTNSIENAKGTELWNGEVGRHGDLVLPSFHFPNIWHVEKRLGAVLSVDDGLYSTDALKAGTKDVAFKEGNPTQVFWHYETDNKTTSDAQIVGQFGLTEVKTSDQLIGVGISLITLDFHQLEPLYVWDK